jgi:hypothetical protein
MKRGLFRWPARGARPVGWLRFLTRPALAWTPEKALRAAEISKILDLDGLDLFEGAMVTTFFVSAALTLAGGARRRPWRNPSRSSPGSASAGAS